MRADALSLVLSGLRGRPLRAWLTVLGVVIGVAAVVSLIAVSQGLKHAIGAQFERFGTNRIEVMPRGFAPPGTLKGLTVRDVERLDALPEFEYAVPYLLGRAVLEYKGEVSGGNIMGFPLEYRKQLRDDFGIDIARGQGFGDATSDAVVLGDLAAKELFESEMRIGDNLLVAGRKLHIIGVMEPFGNPEDDYSIMLPMDVAREALGDEQGVSLIDLKLKKGVSSAAGAESVQRALDRTHPSEDYQVLTAEQLQEQFNSLLGVVQAIIVGIAGISLVVGGVGIMNAMFTAVLDRTREIGVMKAVGASPRSIAILFLMEAAIVAAAGGLLGVGLGFGIALLIQAIAAASGFGLLTVTMEPWLVILGIGFAMLTGVLSGALPARQAAALQPVEALRA
ncbi:ABC transporter permease [Candidatus Woesearchaeota archaeon]|nr:ABC transporter permease [Candidatus Woesearchaeota archaeon]